MPVRYQIEGSFIEFIFEGPTRSHDIYQIFHNAYEDPTCPSLATVLIDDRLSTTRDMRGPEAAKGFARFFLEHPARPSFKRIAVLLPEAALPVYVPVIDEVAEKEGVMIRAFSEERPARQWLEAGDT